MADPRWAQIQAQLIADGIPANDLTLANISTWSIQSTDATIWNVVAEQRLAAYLNQAVYAPVHALFPNAVISNYDNANRTQTIPTGIYWQPGQSYYDTGSIVGNAQSQSIYGQDTIVSTPSGVQQPTPPFQTPIAYISFAVPQRVRAADHRRRRDGDFASPVAGLQVGQQIEVANIGGLWVDPQYAGTFTIASVSSDGTSLVYIDPNTTTLPPANYNLTSRLNTQSTAFFEEWNPYYAFVDEENFMRTEVATSSCRCCLGSASQTGSRPTKVTTTRITAKC